MITKKRHYSASRKTKKKNKPATKQLTYFVKSEYYPPEYVSKVFKSRPGNWKEIRDLQAFMTTGQRIDYIYLDGASYSNKGYFGLLSNYRNVVGDAKRILSQKHKLLQTLTKSTATKKYTMPQTEMDLYELSRKNKHQFALLKYTKTQLSSGTKPYIFKPVSGFSGIGIKIVTTYSELYKYIQQVIKKYKSKWAISSDPSTENQRIWVLQEYISRPLLITMPNNKKYKFHCRYYFIYVPNGSSYYTKKGLVALARQEYEYGNWENKQIHDTHFYNRDGEIWPDVLGDNPSISYIESHVAQLFKHLLVILKQESVACYAESARCYETFAVDLLLTEDYHLKILEVNTKYWLSPNLIESARHLFEGCLDLIVIPGLLKSKPPNPTDYGFIPLA